MRLAHRRPRRDGGRLMGYRGFAAALLWLALVLPFAVPTSAAEGVIAILDFELNDLTGLPPTPQELVRTASISPLLEKAFAHKAGYRPIAVDADDLARANAGFGYLFDHPDAAARLGAKYHADWILVGRLHKPSFLFAYIMARLVNVHTGALVRNYVVEVKGPASEVTPRGIQRLADQIDQTIHPGKEQ